MRSWQEVSIKMGEKGGEYNIIYKCQKCGYEKINKTTENDDFNEIIKISRSEAVNGK